MPARTLGLAEVETRLRALRRRVNLHTVLHFSSLCMIVLSLAGALLVVLHGRATPAAFRGAAQGAAVLCAGVAAVTAGVARRRWVDLQAAAHLADQRAELADRLATLLDLGVHPRRARLAPVLLAQSLGLGDRWRPQRVVPRRVPRSLYLVPLALLALAVSPLAAPEPPAAATRLVAAAATSASQAVPAAANPSNPGNTGRAGDGAAGDAGTSAGQTADAPAAETHPGSLPQADPHPGRPDSGLPDRLPHPPHGTSQAEQLEAARVLAGGSLANSDGKQPSDRSADGDLKHAGAKASGKRPGDGSTGGTGPFQPQTANQQHSEEPIKAGQQPTERRDPQGSSSHSGASPQAGEGSSPGGLMEGDAPGPALADDAPATFKITLSSFLRAVEQKGNHPRQPGKRIATAGAPAGTASTSVALNDRQLRDDALRKAEIPPEYEDIVRRVYSLRPDQ